MKEFFSANVGRHIGIRNTPTNLVFGVEVEVEGSPKLAEEDIPDWKITIDGSLRGDNSKEFVSKVPEPLDETLRKVDDLYSKIKKNNGVINKSMRAGVHIHINACHLTVQQVLTFLACYYCIEDCLLESLPEERQGNLFCLRSRDAQLVFVYLEEAIRSQNLRTLGYDSIRYSAMNLASLVKHGTLEFRAIDTDVKPDNIKLWLSLFSTLLNNSFNFKSPQEVIEAFSANGEDTVLKLLLGPYETMVKSVEGYKDTILSSIRDQQMWIYGV